MLVLDVKTPIKMKAFKSRLFVVHSQFPNIYSLNVFCFCQRLYQRWRFVDDVCLLVRLASKAVIAPLSAYSWYWIAESGPDVTQLSLAFYVCVCEFSRKYLLFDQTISFPFSSISFSMFPYSLGCVEFLYIWIVSFSTSYINTFGCSVPELSFPI